jgi:hypothetical protein
MKCSWLMRHGRCWISAATSIGTNILGIVHKVKVVLYKLSALVIPSALLRTGPSGVFGARNLST